MANDSHQLVVRNAPQSGLTAGQEIALEEDVLTLGRDPLSDIILDDPEVSRHHAKLMLRAGGYEIQDMGSTNGTFVDGKRLGGEPKALKPGQVIMLGSNVTLVYQAPAAVDPLATVVAPAGATGQDEPPAAEESLEEAVEMADVPLPTATLLEEEPEAADEAEVVDAVAVEVDEEDEDSEMATIMDERPIAAPFPEVVSEPSPELPEEPRPATEEPELEPPLDPEPPAATFEDLDERTFVDSAAPVSDFVEAPVGPPPTPPAMGEAQAKGDSNRNVIIIAAFAVLLICLCLAIVSGAVIYFMAIP